MDCPENSVYESDMSFDVPTCNNPDGIYAESLGSGEGCACVDGYIMDAGSCVHRDECGCVYEEEYITVCFGSYIFLFLDMNKTNYFIIHTYNLIFKCTIYMYIFSPLRIPKVGILF